MMSVLNFKSGIRVYWYIRGTYVKQKKKKLVLEPCKI